MKSAECDTFRSSRWICVRVLCAAAGVHARGRKACTKWMELWKKNYESLAGFRKRINERNGIARGRDGGTNGFSLTFRRDRNERVKGKANVLTMCTQYYTFASDRPCTLSQCSHIARWCCWYNGRYETQHTVAWCLLGGVVVRSICPSWKKNGESSNKLG